MGRRPLDTKCVKRITTQSLMGRALSRRRPAQSNPGRAADSAAAATAEWTPAPTEPLTISKGKELNTKLQHALASSQRAGALLRAPGRSRACRPWLNPFASLLVTADLPRAEITVLAGGGARLGFPSPPASGPSSPERARARCTARAHWPARGLLAFARHESHREKLPTTRFRTTT